MKSIPPKDIKDILTGLRVVIASKKTNGLVSDDYYKGFLKALEETRKAVNDYNPYNRKKKNNAKS